MFEQAFKNLDDVMRREGGGVLKYTEQASWLLFLKYLDGLEPFVGAGKSGSIL